MSIRRTLMKLYPMPSASTDPVHVIPGIQRLFWGACENDGCYFHVNWCILMAYFTCRLFPHPFERTNSSTMFCTPPNVNLSCPPTIYIHPLSLLCTSLPLSCGIRTSDAMMPNIALSGQAMCYHEAVLSGGLQWWQFGR